MKLDVLMAIANEAYSGELVWQYYTEPGENYGDTLAEFVAIELKETFDADATDENQLDTAIAKMRMAMDDLENVHDALCDVRRRLKKGKK